MQNVRSTGERLPDVSAKKKRGDTGEREWARGVLLALSLFRVRPFFFFRSSSSVYPLSHTSSRLMNNPTSDGARHASDASDWIFRDTKYTPSSIIIFNENRDLCVLFYRRRGLFPIEQGSVSRFIKIAKIKRRSRGRDI